MQRRAFCCTSLCGVPTRFSAKKQRSLVSQKLEIAVNVKERIHHILWTPRGGGEIPKIIVYLTQRSPSGRRKVFSSDIVQPLLLALDISFSPRNVEQRESFFASAITLIGAAERHCDDKKKREEAHARWKSPWRQGGKWRPAEKKKKKANKFGPRSTRGGDVTVMFRSPQPIRARGSPVVSPPERVCEARSGG